MTFTDARFRDRIRLDSITCVMDAEQVFAAPEQMQLKLWQIASADLLVLNKVDLVGRDQIVKIKAWLDEHFHRYRLIEAERGNVPLEILLSVGRFDATQLDSSHSDHDVHTCHDPHCHHHHGNHARAFSTWSYETDQPMSLDALQEVASRRPANIYRCKGVAHSIDEPKRRAVLQVVGKRVDITLDNEWGDRPPHTRIVAVGAPGAMVAEALREKFNRCIVGARTR